MAEHLYVNVMDLKTRVMNVELRAFEDEKGMMVDFLTPAIEMHKSCDIFAAFIVNKIGWLEIEARGVEIKRLFVVRYT